MNLLEELLFKEMAREAERRVSEFNAQELANTAWAFAAVNLLDKKLFRTLVREAGRRVSEFNAQDLTNMAWAFASVNLFDERLRRILAREAERHGEKLLTRQWEASPCHHGIAAFVAGAPRGPAV